MFLKLPVTIFIFASATESGRGRNRSEGSLRPRCVRSSGIRFALAANGWSDGPQRSDRSARRMTAMGRPHPRDLALDLGCRWSLRWPRRAQFDRCCTKVECRLSTFSADFQEWKCLRRLRSNVVGLSKNQSMPPRDCPVFPVGRTRSYEDHSLCSRSWNFGCPRSG